MDPTSRAVFVIRWIARFWGVALLLFWGAFFVEHLSWFLQPDRLPPASVWLTQALHLLLLVGLLAAWRWELVGGVVVLATAVVFFALVAGPNFLPFVVITGVPAVLWIVCGLVSLRRSPPLAPPG